MIRTNKTAYRRHKYSGPRKSLKRIRGGLKKITDEDSRSKAWRPTETKNNPVKEEIVEDNDNNIQENNPVKEEIVEDNDNNIHIQNTQPKTYARKKTKVKLEATYSVPSTITVKDEPQSDPET